MKMNVKIGLESLVAFVAAYALCLGIAPVIRLSPMFVGIGAGLAYFVYQRMSVEEYYYEEEDGAENEAAYSAPPETLLDAYERSTTKAQNRVLEHLWHSGEMQDFLQMKGCYAPSGATTATTTNLGSMAEVNDDMFDFDASESAEQTKNENEDGLISPIVDETPARPNMATAIDEENFDLFDDELEAASIAPAVVAADDSDEDEMFFDDSILDEEDDDDDELLPEEPEKED